MQIHLQRIVGSYVGSAYGAGQFYCRPSPRREDATAKLANDTRDEDLDGPVGFDSAAQRKREFAADIALQSHALSMAAEGAVAAYEHIVGESWKPLSARSKTPARPSAERRQTSRWRLSADAAGGASAPPLAHDPISAGSFGHRPFSCRTWRPQTEQREMTRDRAHVAARTGFRSMLRPARQRNGFAVLHCVPVRRLSPYFRPHVTGCATPRPSQRTAVTCRDGRGLNGGYES